MLKIRLNRIRAEQSKEMAKYEKETGGSSVSVQKSSKVNKTEGDTITADIANEEFEEEEQMPLHFTIPEFEQMDDEAKRQAWQSLDANKQAEQFTLLMYLHGAYSPRYGEENQAMPGIEIIDESEDENKLVNARAKLKAGGATERLTADDERMFEIAKAGMSKDEVAFSDEAHLENQSFLWSDKYRPRKPRYFNRVHTGFDWNKYNQTHYDIDNPPPKIVQGYRFNVSGCSFSH